MRKPDSDKEGRSRDNDREVSCESMTTPLGNSSSSSVSHTSEAIGIDIDKTSDSCHTLQSTPLLAQRQRRHSPPDAASSTSPSHPETPRHNGRESSLSQQTYSFVTPQKLSQSSSSTPRSSPPSSPFRLGRRTRRMTLTLLLLLICSGAVTIWCTLVLMQQDNRSDPSFHRPLRRAVQDEEEDKIRREVLMQQHPKDRIINAIPRVFSHTEFKQLKGEQMGDPPPVVDTITFSGIPLPMAISTKTDTNATSAQEWHSPHTIPPRIVYYSNLNGDDDTPPKYNPHRKLKVDPMLHAPPGFEAVPQDRMRPPAKIGNCAPMHEWQTQSFPNCNSIHEIDLLAAERHLGGGGGDRKATSFHNGTFSDELKLLGQGWFRLTWRLDTEHKDAVVLKMLRLDREFYDEFFDLHRRDAVAMERLTHSPFVMDIYGFCGQSAINELADFGMGQINSLEKLDRSTRGNKSAQANRLRLQVASSIAVGLAHVHEIDAPDPRPSLVHYDMNPRNIAIVKGGRPKLNDFNIAEFLRWDPVANRTCGFPSRLHEPWWRAPEEVSVVKEEDEVRLVDEKVDVYALGSILFHVLTTHSPRGKMKPERMEGVRTAVERGDRPELPEEYVKSKDPAVKAIRDAMDLCFEPDPTKRASSREVAEVLLDTLMVVKEKQKEKHKKEHAVH